MGRPPHEPTAKTRNTVEVMAAAGIPQDDIARVLGICRDTLRRHYRDELDTGGSKMIAQVAGKLFDTAINGTGKEAVTARIFILKARAGWKDRQTVEHEGTIATRPATEMTDDELAALAAGGSSGAA